MQAADGHTDDPATGDGRAFDLEPRIAKSFLQFAAGFWQGSTGTVAWLLTLGLAASLVLSTYATVQMNHWNRWFFDALERKDVATVQQAVLVFFVIVAAMAAVGVCIVLTRETLQVRWRAWLVRRLLDTWLDRQRFYHLNASGKEPPNPEYRISDDTRWATEILVDLGIGLLSALIGGIAFITILWSVGGSYTLGGITIPGYMVWLALAYGITASVLMAWVGQPLVGRVGQKNEAEGYFRFAMMRLRDNAETIASMNGGPAEKAILNRFYDTVVGRWLAIVKSHGHVTWITNSSGPMIPVIPLIFAAPKYLAGELTLGQVTQLAAAFIQVQIAISWLVDNYNRIAEWYASARRVIDIADAGAAVDADPGYRAPERAYALPPLAPRPGEWLHVAGESGAGKSTFARALADRAAREATELKLMLLPQRVYVPLASLRGALAYPHSRETFAPAAAVEALDRVGLAHLVPRLEERARWDQVLSTGERQRLGLARVLLQRPDVIVLDDTLTALEEPAQVTLGKVLRTALPKAAIVSFAHRPAPAGLATDTRQLRRDGDRVVLVETTRQASPA
jgi:putative ATP-binding cassette transporter